MSQAPAPPLRYQSTSDLDGCPPPVGALIDRAEQATRALAEADAICRRAAETGVGVTIER